MKWLRVSSNSRHENYELWNSDEKLLTVNYYSEKGSIRINTHHEKRVFLIGKQGFLRSRIVLRNEYGIRMGQLTYDGNQDNRGSIELSDEHFTYLIQDGSSFGAAIYNNSEMLLTCELPPASANHDMLILTLCWYISSAVKTKIQEYA
ncbi:MAG TPA: hypothetical protein VFP87_04240 [Chitinophagaceae bacterium]|nr:hypothetical protein [Chitinophagaceae bacterium]